MQFDSAFAKLLKAKCPEDFFGLDDPKQSFKDHSKLFHPDVCNHPKASDAFKVLRILWAQAEIKIGDGTYGDKKISGKSEKIRIVSKTHEYIDLETFAEGRLSIIYKGVFNDGKQERKCLVKVAKSPTINDLLINEGKVLEVIKKHLNIDGFETIFPDFLDSFLTVDALKQKRQVNIFSYEPGWYSVREVLAKYPEGVRVKTMAWMMNRALIRLGCSHDSNVLHCAVNPNHYLINPKEHNGKFIDWCYSVGPGGGLKAVDKDYEFLYPPETKTKQVTVATDLYMLAKTMLMVSGVKLDRDSIVWPADFNEKLKGFFKALLIENPHRRVIDAFEAHSRFKQILLETFGKPKFVEFSME